MSDVTPCAIHPTEPVLGACQRCGDFVCRLCVRGKTLVCAKCKPSGDVPAPDLGTALKYVFNDPDWVKKLAIAAVWFIVGALFFFPLFVPMGYMIRVAQREEQQPQTRLPEWDGFGDLFVLGLKCWLSQLLPALIFFFAVFVVLAAGIGVVIVAGSSGNSAGAQVAAILGSLGVLGGMLLVIALSFAFSLFMPAAQVHHVRTGRIGAGLELREIWRISAGQFNQYILLFVYHFLIQIVGTFVGELACGIGLLVTIPWMLMVQGYLVGRYAGWLDAEQGPIARV